MATGYYGRVAYHDYEGPSLNLDERERLAASMGEHKTLILRNHGLLTAGATVEEAFILMFRLQRACEIQIAAFYFLLLDRGAGVADHDLDVAVHLAEGGKRTRQNRITILLGDADPDPPVEGGGRKTGGRFVEQIHDASGVHQQFTAFAGQHDAARPALEERVADQLFQAFHLHADG